MFRHPNLLSSKACCLSLCIAITLVFFVVPARVAAQTTALEKNQITLQLSVGFGGDAKLDYWTPAWITVQNAGPDFTGLLSATTYTSPARSGTVVGAILPWRYSQQIHVPRGAQRQVSMLVPFYEAPSQPAGVIVTLSDSAGKVVATQNAAPFTLELGSLLIGVLSNQSAQSAGFAPLNAVTLPDASRSINVVSLDASTFPDTAEALSSFDMLVLDEFNTHALNAAQLTALQTWVNQGGSLIEAGGTDWMRTLGSLPPSLLPVIINGTDALSAGTDLLPAGGPSIADTGQAPAPGKLRQAVPISTATLPAQNDPRRQTFTSIGTVLASGATPLMVQAHQGQGSILYLAFDPAAAPLASWPGAVALWKGLLLRGPGDQALQPNVMPRYSNGPGALNLRGGLFQVLQPGTLFPAWTLILLAFGFIILIGPLRFFLIRWLRRPGWSWRIVLASIVVFSLLTYGLAFYQKGASYNSISLIQMNQNGGRAYVTTYFDVFNPGQGAIKVQFPSHLLAQPITIQPFQVDERVNGDDPHYHLNFTLGQNGTALDLPDAGTWTLNPLVSEAEQPVSGGLFSHLALRGDSLVGTVTNSLATSLSDVYILVSHSYVSIGQLPSGQSVQVNVPLRGAATNSTLADQIAKDNRLAVPYFPYGTNAPPQNDSQRHLAILTALSGEGYAFSPCGGPCSTHAIVNEHVISAPPFGSPPFSPVDASDPLMVSGAAATLIGWANQSGSAVNMGDNATIGGIGVRGTHDNLFQVPLTLDFSGVQHLPPGLISGQVVNAQSNTSGGVQSIGPGVYTLSSGSITFELTLPSSLAQAASNVEIVQPLLNQPGGTKGAGASQVRLYNWNTRTWDHVTLNNAVFVTSNTKDYLGTDGRVLVQVADQSQGILLLEKPSLNLNVTAG